MFSGCTSLDGDIDLSSITTTNNSGVFEGMFYGCESLTKFPKLNNGLAVRLYWNTFTNCKSLTNAIIPKCTTVPANCLQNTFNGCEKLEKVIALFTDTPISKYTQNPNTGVYSSNYNFDNWLKGVAEEGVIILNKNIEWDPAEYKRDNLNNGGIPSNWTVKYCDPDDITDIRDYREIDQPW